MEGLRFAGGFVESPEGEERAEEVAKEAEPREAKEGGSTAIEVEGGDQEEDAREEDLELDQLEVPLLVGDLLELVIVEAELDPSIFDPLEDLAEGDGELFGKACGLGDLAEGLFGEGLDAVALFDQIDDVRLDGLDEIHIGVHLFPDAFGGDQGFEHHGVIGGNAHRVPHRAFEDILEQKPELDLGHLRAEEVAIHDDHRVVLEAIVIDGFAFLADLVQDFGNAFIVAADHG